MVDLASQIPFWHFDDPKEAVVFSDGSFGAGFKVQGFDLSCKTDDEINDFTKSIENFLLSIEEGLRVQVFYKLSSDIEGLLESHRTIGNLAPKICSPIIKSRIKHLEDSSFFIPEIYIFFRSKSLAYKKAQFFKKRKPYEQTTREEYESCSKDFLHSLKQVESSLAFLGMKPERLKRKEWFRLCFEYLNLGRKQNIGMPSLREDILAPCLGDQLALTDVEIKKDCLKIGSLLLKTITLKTPPEGFSYGAMIDELTKLPFHFYLNKNVEILNQSRERATLEFKRRLAFAMTGTARVSDLENESKLESLENLLRELMDGSERLLQSCLTVVIWGKNREELEKKTDIILRSFREMNQAEAVVETFPCFDIFIKSLPGYCEGLRYFKLKASNVADLMPLYSPPKGKSRPICLIPTREKSLFSFDPFAKHLPNWNGLVFGGSGSGKSFTISQLMIMFYGQEKAPKIAWIDNGASSQRLLEVLDGEFIDLNLKSGHRLNVFDLKEGEKLDSEKVQLILAVLELMLKGDKGLSRREKALLERAVYHTYEKIKKPVLSDFKSVLDTHSDSKMRKFGEVLFSWTGETAFGRILDGPSNVSLSKDLVTIEIQGLSQYPELKDIFLLLLTSFFQKEASSDLARPYLLIVDEAERLFKTEMAKQFVITCYRTWRKYNAGIFSISQNYRDFLLDENIRDSLMPNASSLFILSQKEN